MSIGNCSTLAPHFESAKLFPRLFNVHCKKCLISLNYLLNGAPNVSGATTFAATPSPQRCLLLGWRHSAEVATLDCPGRRLVNKDISALKESGV